MALRAVVLPAPLGPMSPRMRPSSTRRSTPSSAMVVPKALRRPRASMHAMASSLPLFLGLGLRPQARDAAQQVFRGQTQPLNAFADPGPFFTQELLPFALPQQVARAGVDEH